MDRQTLMTAMGNPVISDDECTAFNAALVQADCLTINRAAMFAAQIGHESVGLRYYEEIASGEDYEWRNDLGNDQPGDGVRYKGRGPIQITGRANYRTLSQWAHSKGYVPTPTYFVDQPHELGTIRYGFLGAVWYWTVARPQINAMCDAGNVNGVTRAINGGLNGIDDRISRWRTCRALGQAVLPTEEIDMAATDDIIGFIKTYVGPLISDVKDIREQLTGSRDLVYVNDGKGGKRIDWAASFKGWKQLGQNPDGSNKTVVDSLADARARIIALEVEVKALKEGK